MRITDGKGFVSGCLFLLIGAAFAIGAPHYGLGAALRPGPGYFPFGLGIILALLGLLQILRSCLGASFVTTYNRLAWRPLTAIIAAILICGLGLPYLGLFLTLPLVFVAASAAGGRLKWREVLPAALGLTMLCWLVFVVALGLAIPVWPAIVH